jgi:hypothetical protein
MMGVKLAFCLKEYILSLWHKTAGGCKLASVFLPEAKTALQGW